MKKEIFSPTTIFKTTDYDKFSFHKKNRKLDFKKVQQLSNAMKERNLLYIFPIVVDKEFVILDGQHRFQAAKDINTEISYIISSDNYGIDNVADSNNFQSHWKVDDYLLFYVDSGKDEYKKLLKLSTKYFIAPGVVASIEGTGKPHNAIKDGTFKFINYELICQILEWAHQFKKKYNFTHWNRRPFLRALRHLIRIRNFNKAHLFSELDANPKALVKCHEIEDYLYLIEDIYNKNLKEKLRFN